NARANKGKDSRCPGLYLAYYFFGSLDLAILASLSSFRPVAHPKCDDLKIKPFSKNLDKKGKVECAGRALILDSKMLH
ncbi:MAG: hypothetical protein K9K86_11240, partial [Pseudomonadales bacterium]|nr:hypothetical protein [Pseudomonadales bacterium]